jgi:hypothetical protein
MSTASASAKIQHADWGDQFLNWFAAENVVVSEKRPQLGAFSYYRFQTSFEIGSRTIVTQGISQYRELAAIKAAAEYVERQTMFSYFDQPNGITSAIIPPEELRTSNGWAVHENEEDAIAKASVEALERHLLLKSYLCFGWGGFDLIEQIDATEMRIYLLASRFSTCEKRAAIVATKSAHHPGVSFGYSCGSADEVQSLEFWEHAIFESVDRIVNRSGRSLDISFDKNSWILNGIKNNLETPFDFSVFKREAREVIEDPSPKLEIKSFDLGQAKNLSFPLYAAYARGETIIPLFNKKTLAPDAAAILLEILKRNNVEIRAQDQLPDWHPIL